MREYKRKIEKRSYGQDDSMFNNAFLLLMLSSIGVMTLVFSLFLMLNIFVKNSLERSEQEIQSLINIKEKQEYSINEKANELAELSKKLTDTDKDLKDRIKTNKYLNSSLEKEKQQIAETKKSLETLKQDQKEKEDLFESTDSTNKDLYRSLELEKEQHEILKTKFDVLNTEYAIKVKEIEDLNSELEGETSKYKTIHEKYLENVDYIGEIESELSKVKRDLATQKLIQDKLEADLRNLTQEKVQDTLE